MLNFSDDNGNQPYSSKRLKMQIFPADNIDTQPLLDELITHGVVIVYSVSGEKFLHIKGFSKHQVINRPSATKIPKPTFTADSVSPHASITDGREGKGKEVIPSLSESTIPTCPHDELIDLFVKQLPTLPAPNKGLWKKGKNAPALKARWGWLLTACHESGSRKGERMATTREEGLAWFSRFFGYVGKSAFLMGNSSDWSCDLIWLVNAANFEKVLQGSYENKLEAA